jgi:acetylornithine deacetylase/succinyl-diaminopimelate desuccinylase-like protein
MNSNHRALLERILPVQSTTGRCEAMITAVLAALPPGVLVSEDPASLGNIYVTKGDPLADSVPCVVAHLDTVHELLPKDHVLTPLVSPCGDFVTGFDWQGLEQVGIGGDDKCGIVAALALLHDPDIVNLKAAFFVDEEAGCLGSAQACVEFFANARFILQADRRGGGDFVPDISGPLSSPEFQAAVAPLLESHGFQRIDFGSLTDVMTLRDLGVGVSVANFSAGYYHPHTAREFIYLPDLDNVIDLFRDICLTLTRTYAFTAAPSASWWSFPQAKSRCRYPLPEENIGWQPLESRFSGIPHRYLSLAEALEAQGYRADDIDYIFDTYGAQGLRDELASFDCLD